MRRGTGGGAPKIGGFQGPPPNSPRYPEGLVWMLRFCTAASSLGGPPNRISDGVGEKGQGLGGNLGEGG